MTYTETQLSAIKIFGKKDLTEGCILKFTDNWKKEPVSVEKIEFITESNEKIEGDIYNISTNFNDFKCSRDIINVFDGKKMLRNSLDIDIEILGHIPHLEDLFEKIKITPNLRCTFPNVGDKTYEVIIFNQHNPGEGVSVKMEIPFLDQPSLPEIISLIK